MHRWIAVAGLLTACAPEYGIPDGVDVAWGAANPAGVAPTEQIDRLLQVVVPVIDILWVIDSSPSMIEDRERLAEAFPTFIEPFEGAAVDWHVGVITTDMETEGHQGQLQERQGVRWLTHDTPDFGDVFTAMTTWGLETDALDERGREAALAALELQADDFNAGFLRDDEGGYLHITVVTDEDDDTEEQVVSVSRFADYIDWLRPYRDRTTFNSVVALADNGAEERGDAYIAVTEAVGGQVFDINAGSWIALLDELGGLQAPEPLTEFFLSKLPVPETLDVKVVDADGITFVYVQDVDYAWSQPRNSVQFLGEPPSEGARIEVRYTVAAAEQAL